MAQITQRDIARRAGVTQGIVSAVLSATPGLSASAETRARVIAVASEMGYRARRRTESKRGVIVYIDAKGPVIRTDPLMVQNFENFFGILTQAMAATIQRQGGRFTIYCFENSSELMSWLLDSSVEGVLWHAPVNDIPLLRWVASRYPFVLVNRLVNLPNEGDIVAVDQGRNVEIAADYLWSLGHRRIAYYGNDSHSSIMSARREAYEQFARRVGMTPFHDILKLPDMETIPAMEKADAILALWHSHGPNAPTAIITGIPFALALLKQGPPSGVSIPDDLSIISIDDSPICELITPTLTAMEQHMNEVGVAAAEMLLRRVGEPEGIRRTIQITPSLVRRQTVKDLRDAAMIGEAKLAGSSIASPLFANAENPGLPPSDEPMGLPSAF